MHASLASSAHVGVRTNARVASNPRVAATRASGSGSGSGSVSLSARVVTTNLRAGRSRRAARDAVRAAAAADDDDDEEDEDFELSAEDIEGISGGEFVVEAFDDEKALAIALVMEVEENAKAAIDARGHFALAVPGGSVAKALAGLKDAKGIDWEKVHVFFVNERVPDGKCFKLACETWASDVPIPPENVHACVHGGAVAEEAAAYEAALRALGPDVVPIDEVNGLPVLDLVLLGMGADGHVGSIYPGSDALADESGAAILGVDMPTKRSVTMSMGLINTAERVVVAASGVGKAETVRRALEEDDEMLPVSSVDAFSTIWFLDLGAASKLEAYQDVDGDDAGDAAAR